jgi:hypothetical protein
LKEQAKIDVTQIAIGAARLDIEPPRQSWEEREGGLLNGKVSGGLVKRHEIDCFRRKVTEDNASNAHGKLCFARRAVLDPDQRGLAYYTLARKGRVWGKLNLNLPFRAGFRHLTLQRSRITRDQDAIPVHVRCDARYSRVPFTREREHAREFHCDSFV